MKWLADECLDNDVIRGLLRHSPHFDIVRVQDLPEISGADDDKLLAWATANDRIVLTHDLSPMIAARKLQLQRAAECAHILLVPDSLAIATVIEQVLLLDQCSDASDWAAGVLYLPLR